MPDMESEIVTEQRPRLTEQGEGCPKHAFITHLMPGEMADASDLRFVYRMGDGTLWANDAPDGVPC
jgi:hypothetical protein